MSDNHTIEWSHDHATELTADEVSIPAINLLLDGKAASSRDIYEETLLDESLTEKQQRNVVDLITKALNIWADSGIVDKLSWKEAKSNISYQTLQRNDNKHGGKGNFYTLNKEVLDAFAKKIARMRNESKSPKSYVNSDEENLHKEVIITTINNLMKKLPTSNEFKEEDKAYNIEHVNLILSFTPSERKLYDLFDNPNNSLDVEALMTEYKEEAISREKVLFSKLYNDESLDASFKTPSLKAIKQHKEFLEASNPTDLYKANLLFWFLVLNNKT